MGNQFEIIEQTIGPVIEIEERVPVWRMPAAFGRDFKTISEYISSQGAEISGMPYARYQEMDWSVELNRGKLSTFFSLLTKRWHFFVGMPCSKELLNKDKLQSKILKSQRYVKGVHFGPYKKCGDTYKALFKWAVAQGLSLKNETIESYVNDPAEVKESEIETLILIPIIQ
jgi:effector-binding domain-containing protein